MGAHARAGVRRGGGRAPCRALRAAAGRLARRLAGELARRAAYRREFAEGADLADVAVLEEAAAEADLPAGELRKAIADEEIKLALRRATEDAWALGVSGVPTLRSGGRIYFGDDRLEAAAAAG